MLRDAEPMQAKVTFRGLLDKRAGDAVRVGLTAGAVRSA